MSDLAKLKQLLTSAKTILIALPLNANQDIVASGLALYLSLLKSGKQTSITSASAPIVRDSHLVGLDKISTHINGNNLVITVNLPESTVDKVTSNIVDGHLRLTLIPSTPDKTITQQDLSFSTSGASADLIIVIGASSLADLGTLQAQEPDLFSDQIKIVNLSNLQGSFGAVNLTDPQSSNSELVTALIKEFRLPIDQDIANNLMQGIEQATKGLSSLNMTADTFEALAVLYRAGARRSQPSSSSQPVAKVIDNTPVLNHPHDQVSPDWLKPKIYKGSTTSAQ